MYIIFWMFVEIASVIAAYTATGAEQLSLNPGQLIQVRKKSPSGWWEGELQVCLKKNPEKTLFKLTCCEKSVLCQNITLLLE